MTDDNGLYYMRARYYNPDIKRFINQDILTGNIGNSASLNRYSYVEGNPVSYTDPFGLAPFDFMTDKIDLSTIIHAALDILGTLPYGDIFDIINAGVYLMEGNYKEAIKSLIFAVPGMDLAGKSAKYAAKGGKYATAAAEVLNTLNTMDKLACVYYAASDFGMDMAYIIYKYGYEKAAFSAETLVEMLSLTAHAIQLGHYSNPFMDTDLTPYIENAWNDIVGDNSLFGKSGSTSVDDFIKSNVNPNFQQNVKEAFMNDAKVTVLKKDIVVYRYHGGTSNGTSYWYTPYQTSNPASDLALPSGNTYQYMDTYIIPKGTTILEGTVAPNFGQPGGRYQFYVSDPSVVIKKER